MANADHVAQLMKGVTAWNAWRQENPTVLPDLIGARLIRADLSGVNFSEAMLSDAILSGGDLTGADLGNAHLGKAMLNHTILINANLNHANLVQANLSDAILFHAILHGAKLHGANLGRAMLLKANLALANLSGAILTRANFGDADLSEVNLSGADLSEAVLTEVNLRKAILNDAILISANIEAATLVDTDLTGADLTGCRIYGVSAWRVKLDGAKQQNLIITPEDEPEITVDNIEVAQFIHLLLHNEKIRHVIDTITSKVVLILGRFTDERKAVLDALREELRKRDYLPILFDFAVPAARDITETVSLLASMARFIVADLTDPSSIPKELEAIVPHLAVPVQPLLEGSSRPYAMFKDYAKYHWVLPIYRYEGLASLLATVGEGVVAPAEAKVKALEERRRMIEAELTKASP
jgi:uncharacterized protein YjbI with pentapeptide repeats